MGRGASGGGAYDWNGRACGRGVAGAAGENDGVNARTEPSVRRRHLCAVLHEQLPDRDVPRISALN